MSIKQRTTNLAITIPDDTSGTHIGTEYGCRFPDGHHEWRHFNDHLGVQYAYENVANHIGKAAAQWRGLLEARAERAHINPDTYEGQHTLVKRMVILTTTAPEEVQA
jgi:hypothetical protein